MATFNTKEEYEAWITGQDWYQTIELKDGLKTPGKFPTNKRKGIFDSIDFKGKSVLDVGCNSGQYCFMAKERGAGRVVGVDVLEKRITQAKVLAENEGYDAEFYEKGIFDLDTIDGTFDVVLCIAVLTEVSDLFGAIEALKKKIGSYALIELDIAKPLVYLSASKRWLKGYEKLSRRTAVTEVRYAKSEGWVISPSFDVLTEAFGEEFTLTRKPGGIRYDLVEVVRK